ncbi:MAG: hypothetical protein AAF685_08070 [Cyanobacteria bacterium P01_C01_bin.89]
MHQQLSRFKRLVFNRDREGWLFYIFVIQVGSDILGAASVFGEA